MPTAGRRAPFSRWSRHFKCSAPSLEAHLVTAPDGYPDSKKVDYLERIRDPMVPLGVDFIWKSIAAHTRLLKVDNRRGIPLDHGLEIRQRFDSNDAFSIEARMSEMCLMKAFVITYMKVR